MKRSTPNPVFFMALTGFALVASGGLVYWQYGQSTTLSAKVRTLEKEVSDISSIKASVERSRVAVDDAQLSLTHLESGVSTAKYVPTLLKELQIVGASCGLDITGVRPVPVVAPPKPAEGSTEPRPKKKAYTELDVEVRCLGTFGSTMSFMKRLQEFPKIVGIRSLSVNPKVTSDGLALSAIESTVNLRIYVFPPDANLSASAPAGKPGGSA